MARACAPAGTRLPSNILQPSFRISCNQLGCRFPPELAQGIKDITRAVVRGLGPGHLKDSFNVWLLRRVTGEDQECRPFDLRDVHAIGDFIVACCWRMLREAEIAAAVAGRLQLHHSSREVSFLLPIFKTDAQCRQQELCPFCAAERHLRRLQMLQGEGFETRPLLPNSEGAVASMAQVIASFRNLVRAEKSIGLADIVVALLAPISVIWDYPAI